MSGPNQTKSLAKTYADPRMFWEGMRQLRVLGVLYLVLLEVAVLLLCYEEVGRYTYPYSYSYAYSQETITVSFSDFTALIPLAGMAAAILMTLYLFRFQNRRESADFYHALPNTRGSLFTSFFAAVLAWVWIGVILAAVTAVVGLYLFCHTALVDFPSAAEVASCLFFAMASGLFSAAVTALAMAFTGTLLSNVLVTAMFAAGPRLLTLVYFELLGSVVPVLPPMGDNSLFDLHYNPFFFPFSNFHANTYDVVTAALYSLVVGAVYAVLACLVFRRRRSEIAGQAAPNRILQAVFRLTISMLICLIPCAGIVGGGLGGFECLVYYLIALTVYFLYELLTTRKVRNLWKAVPSLGILLVLNAAFIGSFSVLKSVVNAQLPTADQIRSVTFHMDQYTDSYLDARAGNVALEDASVRRLVADRLRIQVTGQGATYFGDGTRQMVVDIRTDSGTITRRLSFQYGETQQILQEMQESEQYQAAYMNLPPISDSFSFKVADCSTAQCAALYERLKEDIAAMGFDAWYSLVNGATEYDNAAIWSNADGDVFLSTRVYLSGDVGSEFYSNSFPLSTLLPRTTELYLKYRSEDTINVQTLRDEVASRWYAVSVSGLHLSDGESDDAIVNFDTSAFSEEGYKKAEAFIDELLDRYEENRGVPVDLSQPVYALDISWEFPVIYVNVEKDMVPDFLTGEFYEYYAEAVPATDGASEQVTGEDLAASTTAPAATTAPDPAA